MDSKREEALSLASDILKDIELNQVKLSGAVSKAMRLARLLGDDQALEWLRLEFSGYPQLPGGIPQKEFMLAARSNRHEVSKDKNGAERTTMNPASVGKIENDIDTWRAQLAVSGDVPVSISSANPYQSVATPWGNAIERGRLTGSISSSMGMLEKIKASIYDFVLENYFQLKFGQISEAIFENTRSFVDKTLSSLAPNAIQELVSAYQNINSNSESDWSNAGNSCRRLLKEVADAVYPADPKKKTSEGHKLDESAYVNRLIQFAKENSESSRFKEVVGSNIKFLTDRLDALIGSSSKGVHAKVSKKDAERYVIYTYLIAGDILSLVPAEELQAKGALPRATTQEGQPVENKS